MTPNRVWFARDCWLSADPKVEDLGARHGAGGILAFEETLALAKLADKDGEVRVTYGTLAKRAWLKSTAEAKRVVATMLELGLVEPIGDNGPAEARLLVPMWGRWQVADPTAADRSRRYRERNKHRDADRDAAVTLQRDADRDVTPLQKYRQQNVKDLPPLAPTETAAENRGTA